MGRPPSKAAQRRAALAAWWRRYYWPAIILAVDPGSRAGAAVLRSVKRDIDVIFVGGVDTDTRDLESVVSIAISYAKMSKLPLVLAIEDWGRGGPLGIDQWIGLGAARGAWIRAYRLALDELDDETRELRVGPVKIFAERIVRINQRTWRSRCIDESGTRDEAGKWTAFDPKGWKNAAVDACQTHLRLDVDDPDAAEALLLGFYCARSDDLGKALPKTHLARYGLTFPPADRGTGRPKIRKRRRSPDNRK